MTLYLKYRPQILDELDLDSVRDSLKKIFSKDKNLPHAFLFSGPKGTGKTSAARIVAKIINCKTPKANGEPCNSCEECLAITKGTSIDVIEMDAASNRGIDDIRSLKENVILSPVVSRKKVYIIDEAHMLTTEAANAFLKTLEEPPAHVVFILATTNPEKLPATVISRLTSVNFQKANKKEIARQLERVVKGEKLKIGEEVIDLISEVADGSFRDAVKILESLLLADVEMTKEKVEEILLQSKILQSDELLKTIFENESKKAIEMIEGIIIKGGSAKNIIDELIRKLHKEVLGTIMGDTKTPNVSSEEIYNLINLLIKAKEETVFSPVSQLPLEIAVVKWIGKPNEGKTEVKKTEKEESVKGETDKKTENKQTSLVEKKVAKKEFELKEFSDEVWRKVLENLRVKNATVEGLLRAATPLGFDGQTLTVGVYYKFHKERLEVIQNKKIFEEMLCNIMGKNILKVNYELTEKEIKMQIPSVDTLTRVDDTDIIDAAKEIFGN